MQSEVWLAGALVVIFLCGMIVVITAARVREKTMRDALKWYGEE